VFWGALELSGAVAEVVVTEKPGDHIGRYRLLEKIGEGGCGMVYMAEQTEPIRRRVALKVIKLGMDTRQVIARFEAERQALALMDHPNIAKVLDAGATDTGRPYFVMELVRGIRITEYCDQNNLSTRERLDLFMQVCYAIQHAHQKGIIHRDIKPSNILVTLLDGVPVPKVIDFGIAKATQQPLTDKTLFTGFHQLVGTLAYMSPEQAEMGPQDIDTRSDVYTLGVLLYELLTGRSPFEQKELLEAGLDEMRRLIREKEPPKPSTRLSTLAHDDLTAIARSRHTEPPRLLHLVRGDLDWIVMKCLEKDRARRYGTATELAHDVERHLNQEPVTAAAPSALYRTGKFIRRHRIALATATVLALLLAAGVVVLAVARGFRIERDVAPQITALRSAELAARSGQWRQALKQWYQAEAAGYNDQVYLGLKRAEAWTVLSEPARAEAELRRLAKRSDLKNQSGAVLLRLGEHELFDKPTFANGVEHVQAALAAGLMDADHDFAKGLLAESTLEALDWFRQALQRDPYHHGAHVQSMGLEFLLGRYEELKSHFRVFKTLYPDDPSPRFLEATELALQGRLEEAEALLGALPGIANTTILAQLHSSLRVLAKVASRYQIEVLLEQRPFEDRKLGEWATEALSGAASELPCGPGVRTPQLPCLQRGLLEGSDALRSLAIPLVGNPVAAVKKVKSSWQRHPEAYVPVLAAMLLDNLQPRQGPKSPSLLQIQADLFQMGADSASIMPNLPRLARFLAARSQFELACSSQTNGAPARAKCLEQVRRAAVSDDLSAAECREFCAFASDLGDFDLARAVLNQWERRQPGAERPLRSRIQLELAAGAFDPALRLIDRMLAKHPDDAWALGQRKAGLEKLEELYHSSTQAKPAKP
jgi:hypothetical protein